MRRLLQTTKLRVPFLILIFLSAACASSVPPATLTSAPPSTAPPALQETAGPTPGEANLTALLSQVQGDVTVVDTGAAGERTTRPARPMQVLAAGVTVSVGTGAQAGLICSNERWVDLAGGSDWQLTQAACTDGRELPAGTFKGLAPKAGRIAKFDGSLVIEGETREKESNYGRIPIVLSPRNTALLDAAPELRWVEVPGAIEYVAHLVGPTSFPDQTLDGEQLSCVEDPRTAPHRTCSAPWPAAQWPLVEEAKHYLTIGARLKIASDPGWSESNWLQLVGAEKLAQVQAEREALHALELDAVTRDLLLAGLYAVHELYGHAISTYEGALAVQPAPVLYVTLGDGYRQINLHRWAFSAYQSALAQDPDDPAVRAAAEFGLGQVYYAYQGDYAEARVHYAEAVHLYQQLDALEELAKAQEGLDEAQRRLP